MQRDVISKSVMDVSEMAALDEGGIRHFHNGVELMQAVESFPARKFVGISDYFGF